MPGILSIASCQHPVGEDIRNNLHAVLKQMRKARDGGADIAHFPECNLSGYAGIDFPDIGQRDHKLLQESLEKVQKQAAELGIWAVIGSYHFGDNQKKPYNSLYIIDGKGEIAGRYDKRFLAGPPWDAELKNFIPGARPVMVRINGVACGFLICHEWRYPELYREYYRMKAEVILQSWYDGNLSREEYETGGKELGSLICGSVRGYAANNHLWLSGSNTSRRESSFPAFMVRPDGRVLHKLARNRAGVLISRIDSSERFIDPSALNRDRLLRRAT
jgi:predicted amidohydrolase